MRITKIKAAPNYNRRIELLMGTGIVQAPIALVLKLIQIFVSNRMVSAIVSPLLSLIGVGIVLTVLMALYFSFRNAQFEE